MKVFVVAVAGEKEHQRLQIAVQAIDDLQAMRFAVHAANDRYGWKCKMAGARIVAHEGEPLQPPIMRHIPDRVVPV